MVLENKVAIITGASKGIGKAIALDFAENGCHVALVGRNQKELENVQKECQKHGVKTYIFVFDLSNLKEIPTIVDETISKLGKVNIVVNNAGIFANGDPYKSNVDDWDKVIAVNTQAPYHLTNYAIQKISKSDGGAIIFVSSIVAKMTFPNGGVYCMSKHAISAYADCLFEPLREKNIMVTTLHPGIVDTEMGRKGRPLNTKMIAPKEIAKILSGTLKISESSCVRDITIDPRISSRNI